MRIYDFQEATADRIAEIFRGATIGPDGKERKTGGQRRVLLADEVGLGKTHVAEAVIDRVRRIRQEVNDDMFRVVYVCSNLGIASQNISKLGIQNEADVTESRLSMQHLSIREREAKITDKDRDEMGEIIIPLTPSTSFALHGRATGNINERALIAAVLLRFDELRCHAKFILESFRGNVADCNWRSAFNHYCSRINRLGDTYITDVKRYLNSNADFIHVRSRLLEAALAEDFAAVADEKIINRLRRIFADLSLSMLEPDLIIMDEFQRFSSLLDYSDDSEQSAIVRKFFEQKGGQQPLILLLSATPYKPFSTLEELNEYNADEHYEDFSRLMDFLFNGGGEFREVWSDYSHRLSHLSAGNFDVLLASKASAEGKMYEAMCRTERLNEGLVSTQAVAEMPIDTDDIVAYCEMQKIVKACNEASDGAKRKRFTWSGIPVEYVKSSPYLLSFMDSYELKKQIETVYASGRDGLSKPDARVLLRESDIAQFHKIPMRNARMQCLRDMMLPKGKGAEMLLWVPASIPYYETNAQNPFARNREFSKVLVFSAWEMVPRMIATLMTYEAERENIFAKYKKAGYEKATGENRIKSEAKEILIFPSIYLATLYNPQDYFGEKLSNIKAAIKRQLKERLSGIATVKRRNYAKILAVLKWLDNPESERPTEMPESTLNLLTDMAIGAPGVCLRRTLKGIENEEKAISNAAAGFFRLFNRRTSGYIIDRLQNRYHDDEIYLEGVMDYCVAGNLQAVLDEYRHLCSTAEEFVGRLAESFIDVSRLGVDTDRTFGRPDMKKRTMRTLFAMSFTKTKNASEDKTEPHSSNVRTAFQSPFYPFVLASTSVGQEGLDFHWYCRKIVHWNLPSNPQDLEQREGRINRYKCLAIRRNLAKIFTGILNWDELFEKANAAVRAEFGDKYCGIVPNWCLPTEWIERYSKDMDKNMGADKNMNLEWIERIVPEYPMSSDVDRYRRLIGVLSLYRLTMGQPRQEELLEMLQSQRLTPSQITSLLINLSPIARKGNTN